MKKVALVMECAREYGRSMLKGIARYAQERGDWRLRLMTPADLKAPDALAGFDGVIARVAEAATRRRLKSARIPVVDGFCQCTDSAFIGIDADHVAIARLAARYFLAKGHTHFAYCGFPRTTFSDRRRDEFVRILAKAGFKCAIYDVPEPPNDAALFDEKADAPRNAKALKRWLASLPRPTAIFCANDLRAHQILTLARERKIDVPREFAVLGVDDDTLLCALSMPSLSSIDPNADAIGYGAARLLDTAISERVKPKLRPVRHVKCGGLSERESSCYHPIKPEWFATLLTAIDRNLSHPIGLSDLMRLSDKSHTTIEMRFKRAFGLSAHDYILKIRLDEAARLISDGTLSSKEIAYRTGFSSPQYFCYAYRARFGHAPFES